MMASIRIRPATLADEPAINTIHYKALDTFHDFYGAFFALHPRDLLPKLNARALRNPQQKFLVAEAWDDVVGFVRWEMVSADGEVEGEKVEMEPMGPLVKTKDHLEAVWERFNEREGEMERCYKGAAGGLRHACEFSVYACVIHGMSLIRLVDVKHLMVHPDHQRKGIGHKLLSEVISRSDELGVPTFIVSSAEAYALYGRLGFQDLETFSIDNGYWAQEVVSLEEKLGIHGNEGLAKQYEGVEEVERYMIRSPKAGKA